MRIGRLRHRVTIQQLVPGSPQQDSGGEPDENWTNVKTVYADIRPVKGRELVTAQQTSSEVSGIIEIRYRAGVTSKMRILYGSRIFDILSVVNVNERNQRLEIAVRELVNNG